MKYANYNRKTYTMLLHRCYCGEVPEKHINGTAGIPDFFQQGKLSTASLDSLRYIHKIQSRLCFLFSYMYIQDTEFKFHRNVTKVYCLICMLAPVSRSWNDFKLVHTMYSCRYVPRSIARDLFLGH